MKTWMFVVGVLALAARSEAAPTPKVAWSVTADGVHARLVVTATKDDQKRAQVGIALEIENVSDTGGPLALPWADDPEEILTFVLEDDKGTPIAMGGQGGSYASTGPYLVNLPVRATLHQEITSGAIEYVSAGKTMLRPVTFQSWDLPAKHGKLYLRATLKPRDQGKGVKLPRQVWNTPLDLPRVLLP